MDNRFDDIILKMIWFQLSKVGFFKKHSFKLSNEIKRLFITGWYDKWLIETMRLFVVNGFLEQNDNDEYIVKYTGITEDEINKLISDVVINSSDSSNTSNLIELASKMLSNLSDIITNKKQAVTIMFQDGYDMVGGIYKGNKLADYYNEVLAKVVCAYIEEIIINKPDYKLNILEIGAGTGGTSSLVFKYLEQYRNNINDYLYTDISSFYFKEAKKNYASKYPYISFKIYDVEKDIISQGLSLNNYDIVISANCIHATSNIFNSLSAIKKLLKNNGMLILNEMSQNTVFAHVTFGLLEGWWKHEDDQYRVVGSPVVDSNNWKKLMNDVGFVNIIFPVSHSHEYGQQIVACFKPELPIESSNSSDSYDINNKKDGKSVIKSNTTSNSRIHDIIISSLVEVLEVDPEMIDDELSFSDLGIDSITGMNLVQNLNAKLNIEIDPTSIFDYNNVKKLEEYLCGINGDSNELQDDEGIDDQSEVLEGFNDEISSISDEKVYLENIIKEIISDVLEVDKSILKSDYAFSELGVDSITGMQIVEKINEKLNLDLDVTDIFDFTNIGQLSEHIVPMFKKSSDELIKSERKLDDSTDNTSLISYNESSNSFDDNDIAIIGMSGRFGSATDIDEYWDVLKNGVTTVEDKEGYYYSKLKDNRLFDNEFFNISLKEAQYMDPQQRIFLQEAWNALEDAGYATDNINGAKCGVYVGCNSGDYSNLFDENAPAQAFWGNAASITPSRIAYFLNLKGPAISLETACSSSLVAVELAYKALSNFDIDIAICGGVFIQNTDSFLIASNKAGMLSKDGKCFTFDERANGFVTGEGAGAIVIKRYSDAIRDNDNIYAVIKGIGVNQDGETNGITAPNSLSQENLEVSVYENNNIDPSDITYVEAHGTGTKLGDPIEVKALTNAFRKFNDNKNYCYIGSVKTNIGHTITAAGIASLLKVILAMQHGTIPAHLNYEKTNKIIDLQNSPFIINTKSIDWKLNNGKRVAAISSFGFSGTNVHMVLEQYQKIPSRNDKREYLFAFSSKSEFQLRQYLDRFLKDTDIELYSACDVSYTLLFRRKHFDCRVAFIAKDIFSLKEKINSYISGECSIDKLVESNDELLVDILDQFIEGKRNSFDDIMIESGHCVSLPTFVFRKNECWIEEKNLSYANHSLDSSKEIVYSVISNVLNLNKEDLTDKCTLKELGMDSIFIVEIVNELKKNGLNFEYSDFKCIETVGDIFNLLKPDTDTFSDEIVKLNNVKTGLPVFWFHPSMGGVDVYEELASKINRPFYACAAKGWLTRKKAIHGIENMSRFYIELIKRVQPEGPYELGGYSLGGIIAYEVARQLQESGEQVKNVVMVDAIFDKDGNTKEQNDNEIIFSAANSFILSDKSIDDYSSHLVKNTDMDFGLDNNEFLDNIVHILKAKNSNKNMKLLKNFINSSLKVRKEFAISEYNVLPLPYPDKTECLYFYNTSGKMLGDYADYIENKDNKMDITYDSSSYKIWENSFANFNVVNINAPNHMDIFSTDSSKDIIINNCSRLYND